VPTRTRRAHSRIGPTRYVLSANGFDGRAPDAVLPAVAVRRKLFVERRGIRVEFRPIVRSQRRPHIIALGLEDLLVLFSLRRALLPESLECRGITALARIAHRLHVRLGLLAQRLHLRRVLRLNGLEVRLLGVAECDALEKLTAKTASAHHSARAVGTLGVILMHALRRGLLLCANDRRAPKRESRGRQRDTNIEHGEPPPVGKS